MLLKNSLFIKKKKSIAAKTKYVEFNSRTISTATVPLVAWYDFSDISTLYQDQAGNTPVTAALQPIGKINNKAKAAGVSSKRLGTALHATDNDHRPKFQKGSLPRQQAAKFDGVDDFLICNTTTGNANGSNSLSSTTLNTSALTMYFVVLSDNATITSNETVFSFMNSNESSFKFLIDHATDHWAVIAGDAAARTNTVINSGVDVETGTSSPELWCVRYKGGVGSGTSLLLKNGVKKGIANGSGDDLDFDMSTNDAAVQVSVGCKLSASGGSALENYDGQVYEILVFDGQVSEKVHLEVIGSLIKKYDITILTS
tara:strand:- start:55 stop:996 length:942 start_codon:yes stop_codon:yes gene_type:complete